MDKNTVYILQKDLPFAKAGAEFIRENEDADYYNTNFANYHDRIHKSRVINNIEWFKPKEEVNESKPTEQFQWTNELVMEFVNFHDEQKGIHWLSEDIEKFKQSKSKTEQPLWEILEFEHSSGKATFVLNEDKKYFCQDFKDEYFNLEDLLHNKLGKTYNIKKVKRLSDGEVFSVGDSLDWMGKIESIEIDDRFNGGIAFINNSQKSCISTAKKAPKEEQVPIKVEIMEFGYGKPQENKGKFYVANFNLPNNAKLPTEKYKSIKSAIEDVLNEDKIKHEKLLSKIESKVRLANMINTQANYLKETLDYINSLK